MASPKASLSRALNQRSPLVGQIPAPLGDYARSLVRTRIRG